MLSKAGKTHYTESEAAAELEVSVERLRAMIREHILPADDEVCLASSVTFQASDLLVLKWLSLKLGAAV
jgi:hypothetical protein